MDRLITVLEKLESKCKLFIFDVNGVLDHQNLVKLELIRKYSDSCDQLLIHNVLINIERIYEDNKCLTMREIIVEAFLSNNLKIGKGKANDFEKEFFLKNSLSSELVHWIEAVSVYRKVVLYTSLSHQQLMSGFPQLSTPSMKRVAIFSRDRCLERKPSIVNLQKICGYARTTPARSVLIGDNVVSDLMPAKLLGMKTILVSHYADFLIHD